MTAGIRFDMKGIKVSDSIQYFHTIITVDNGSGDQGTFEGAFNGTNSIFARNCYLSVPIFGGYGLEGWDIKMGVYLHG